MNIISAILTIIATFVMIKGKWFNTEHYIGNSEQSSLYSDYLNPFLEDSSKTTEILSTRYGENFANLFILISVLIIAIIILNIIHCVLCFIQNKSTSTTGIISAVLSVVLLILVSTHIKMSTESGVLITDVAITDTSYLFVILSIISYIFALIHKKINKLHLITIIQSYYTKHADTLHILSAILTIISTLLIFVANWFYVIPEDGPSINISIFHYLTLALNSSLPSKFYIVMLFIVFMLIIAQPIINTIHCILCFKKHKSRKITGLFCVLTNINLLVGVIIHMYLTLLFKYSQPGFKLNFSGIIIFIPILLVIAFLCTLEKNIQQPKISNNNQKNYNSPNI